MVLALRLPVVNQLEYADAWFYSGYGWAPKHHFSVFGFNYFAVRFPAVVSIGGFEKAFGAPTGYLLLRYGLAVATGASLYLLMRRFATVQVALATAVLLHLHPFFSRMLLWDYSYFVVVSAGTIGLALWWWAEGRHWSWTLLAGAALSAAAFAHATFATLLLVFVVVELVAGARRGGVALRDVIARLALCAAAGVGVFVSGWLIYLALLGSVEPVDILAPTIDFLRDNDGQVSPYVRPTEEWLLRSPRIWVPILLCVALVAALRRRLLGTDLPARIAQLCIGFTAFVWVFRFTVTSSFIETWWSYHITVVVMAPALGVLLHTLAPRLGNRIWVAVAAAALTAVIVRNAPFGVEDAYGWLNSHATALVVFVVLATILAIATGARRRKLAMPAVVALLSCTGVMAYSPDVMDGRGGTGIFGRDGDREWSAYRAGHELLDLLRRNENPGQRIALWYPTDSGYANIAWVDMPQLGHTVQVLGVPSSFRTLPPVGRARLLQPQFDSVLVMSPRAPQLRAARRALTTAGFRTTVEEQGRLADGALRYALLRFSVAR